VDRLAHETAWAGAICGPDSSKPTRLPGVAGAGLLKVRFSASEGMHKPPIDALAAGSA